MKNKLLNVYEKIQKLTFFQGVALTLCLTSIVSIAATNLQGLFVFSPGTPISSSEINANFDKVSGIIVAKASYSTPFSVTQSSFIVPSDCATCNVYRKKMAISSITAGSFSTTTDQDSNNASNTANFSYFTIPSDGWYEIQFLGSTSTAINAGTSCDGTNCDVNVNANVSVHIANSLTEARSSLSNISIGWQGNGRNQRDSTSDGIFEPETSWPGMPGEAKKYFLKSGQILFIRFDGSYNATTATAVVSAGLNSFDLTLIKH